MRTEASIIWQNADDNARVDMLKRALGRNFPIDAVMLDEEISELDKYAQLAGLVPVLVPTVADASGLSSLIPAVVDSQFAHNYWAR